jgi:hypothetical protein
VIGIASRPTSGVDVGRGDGTVVAGAADAGRVGRAVGAAVARGVAAALGRAVAVGSADAVGTGELDVAGGTTTPPTAS